METGCLIYLNTTFFKGLSADLQGYRREHPFFPDQPMSNQFFDEREFDLASVKNPCCVPRSYLVVVGARRDASPAGRRSWQPGPLAGERGRGRGSARKQNDFTAQCLGASTRVHLPAPSSPASPNHSWLGRSITKFKMLPSFSIRRSVRYCAVMIGQCG